MYGQSHDPSMDEASGRPISISQWKTHVHKPLLFGRVEISDHDCVLMFQRSKKNLVRIDLLVIKDDQINLNIKVCCNVTLGSCPSSMIRPFLSSTRYTGMPSAISGCKNFSLVVNFDRDPGNSGFSSYLLVVSLFCKPADIYRKRNGTSSYLLDVC